MIMKMNFNFNFNIEDSPAPPNQSIRRITTANDQDHTVEIRPRNASGCREGIELLDVNKPPMSSDQRAIRNEICYMPGAYKMQFHRLSQRKKAATYAAALPLQPV
jgi:hypothetical protein